VNVNDFRGHRRGDVHVAVVGPGRGAEAHDLEAAWTVGYELARHDAVLVCGGLGGVMQAACEGLRAGNAAEHARGQAIGFLPGSDPHSGNEHLTLALPTGLGELRNGLVVRAADAVIAVGCSWGTLSEISLALSMAKPTITIANHGWEITYRHNQPERRPLVVSSPQDAVREAVKRAGSPAADPDAR
jgi:uncharacterized protein (TIGR00725 family)